MITNNSKLNLLKENAMLIYLERNDSFINGMAVKIINCAKTAKQCIPFYDHSDQTIQEYINTKLKSEEGLSQGVFWKSIPKWRLAFKIPETLIISALCKKYLSIQDKTIEIGSGKLEDGLSYLMQRMPPHLQTTVQPTEVNALFTKGVSQVKKIDLCNLDKSYASSSLNKIIGSSILDVLSKSDLSIALDQIHTALKPGGLLLHFVHLEPYSDTLLTSFREDSSVCFPWEDEDCFKGLHIIPKDKLREFIETNEELSDFAREFLSWYSDLTTSERELTLNTIITDHQNHKQTSIDFSNWIQALNPKGIKKIDNNAYFEERMRKGLEAARFEILEFGYQVASHIRDRKNESGDLNYFVYELGKKTATKIYVLQPGKVCHGVKMHVIVAKKKSSASWQSF